MRLVSLAEQILRPPAYLPLLQELYLESRAIEIVAEALHVIALKRDGVSVAEAAYMAGYSSAANFSTLSSAPPKSFRASL